MLPRDKKISLIGGGNMGGALAGGLLQGGHPRHLVVAADPDAERRRELSERLGIRTLADNLEACRGADLLVLAVKPQQLGELVATLRDPVQSGRPLVLSMAAGITLATLERWLGADTAIVRAMPNTPALLGRGATGLLANGRVTAAQRDMAAALMRAVGVALWFDTDAELDIVTAVSGSGPAYFFLIMESLERSAVDMGISSAQARQLILATAQGAAELAGRGELPPEALRRQVTSPGGVTERAIQVLQAGSLHELLARALEAGRKRAAELSQQAR